MSAANSKYFTLLFESHHRAIYAYAFKKSKDSFVAEEIAQTTFIKFWQYHLRTDVAEQEHPEKLLFFIAKALLVDFYRKKSATISIENMLTVAEDIADDNMDRRYEVLQFSNMMQAAANTLPDRQKLVFEKSYFEDLTHDQIAKELNISRQTVKNQLSKALKQVRKKAAEQFLSTFIGLL